MVCLERELYADFRPGVSISHSSSTLRRQYPYRFPTDIPPGTAIPAWAYLDITTWVNFNATEAEDYEKVNHTEVTGSLGASTASAATSSTNGVGTGRTTSFSTSAAATTSITSPTSSAVGASSKKSNTGAIAGGVVGGVAGVACAIVLLVLWYRVRKLQKPQPSYPSSQPTPALPMSPVMSTGKIALYVSECATYYLPRFIDTDHRIRTTQAPFLLQRTPLLFRIMIIPITMNIILPHQPVITSHQAEALIIMV